MPRHLSALAAFGAATILVAGCGSTPAATTTSSTSTTTSTASTPTPATATSATAAPSTATPSASESAGMPGHEHPMDGGPAPAGIKPAANPKFPVGTKVTLQADHMPGMKGAPATVVGAFSTVTYAVDYEPTTGGAPVKNHKWVVQEELAGVGANPVPDGGAVTLDADHMPGMKGAKGAVVSSTKEPVYMVDYTADGMTMKNHKWVTEGELTPAS